jgi:hypothetical protein
MIVLAYSILIRLLGVYKKPNILACGLFGACGLNIDYSKLITLGVANDSRGGDGNGYYNGHNLIKGVDLLRRFENHVKEAPLVKARDSKVFIGHTRKATHGKHTSENTHPFLIGTKESGQIILAHNGQIFNTTQMCEKYDVDATGVDVDSKILAMLIQKVGAETILKEYKGYAALIWTDLREPDSLYMYHGASQEYTYNNAKVEEERPLFYIQLRNTIYFSSLVEPLKLIRENRKQKPYVVPVNKIIRLRNGMFSGKLIPIEREKTNIGLHAFRFPASTTTYPPTTHSAPYANNHHRRAYDDDVWSDGSYNARMNDDKNYTGYTTGFKNGEVVKRTAPVIPATALNIHVMHNIAAKLMPKSDIFWYGGRYYLRPTPVSDPVLAEGTLYVDKDMQIFERHVHIVQRSTDVNLGLVPKTKIIENALGRKVSAELKCFFKGILMKSTDSYETVHGRLIKGAADMLDSQLKNPSVNTASILSHYSMYPITLLPNESDAITNFDSRKVWYHDGRPATCTGLKPQMSMWNITIREGSLLSVSRIGGDFHNTDGNTGTESKTAIQLSLPVGNNPLRTPFVEEIPLTKDEEEQIREYEASLQKVRESELWGEYVERLQTSIVSSTHCDRLVDPLMEEAIKNFLVDYHESKTAGFDKLPNMEKNTIIEENYNDLLTDECIGKSFSIQEAVAFMQRCTLQSLEDHLCAVIADKYNEELNREEDEAEDEEIESDVENEVESLIEDEYLHKQAVSVFTYDRSSFAQDVAKVLFKVEDSLKDSLNTVCKKHGKTSILELIESSKKIIQYDTDFL